MQRCPNRIALAAACLFLAATGPGCSSIGLRRDKAPESDPTAFYDEFFGQDDDPADDVTSTTPGEAPPSRLFKRNRLPGGLSSEAREIEQGSFNIY